jgi:hypothetical protein
LRTVNVPDEFVRSIVSVISDMVDLLGKGKDLRLALGRAPELQHLCRGMVDVAKDADTCFAFMILFDFIGVLSNWDGRTDGWYSLNAESVADMKQKLKKYLERLSDALQRKDYDAIVECTKDWVLDSHLLTSKVSRDVRATAS